MDTTSDLAPILTQFASTTQQEHKGFVALDIFPLFPVTNPNSSYWLLADGASVEAPPNILRQAGAGFARSSTRLSDDKYACKLYGQEEPVGDAEDANTLGQVLP